MSNSVMSCQNATVKNDFVKSLEADGVAESRDRAANLFSVFPSSNPRPRL